MANSNNRRNFIKAAAGVAGAGWALGAMGLGGCATSRPVFAAPGAFKAPSLQTVRMGIVGVGGRGTHLLNQFLSIDGVEVKAVCDIVESKVANAQDSVVKKGQPRPEGYVKGEWDFRSMCDRGDLDMVVTATPWDWHTPVCLAALKAGKHAVTEVPAAVTLDECWQLVETSEAASRHCVMLENCCYGRNELFVLNLVRKGLLGEVLHGECGYCHDMRALQLSDKEEGKWRLAPAIKRNGNVYPTHGLGPVAQCMDINRSDAFDYLVSMSCNSRGLQLFAAKKFGPESPQARQKYIQGDVNSSLIRTKQGKTIMLVYDGDTPRPYSRINLVQGTKGICQGYPDRAYIEGLGRSGEWQEAETLYEQYDHPLWKKLEEKAKGSGHGGMDFIVCYRLIRCLQTGEPMDADVYDAAAWSAVTELSQRSAAGKSKAMDFPDFTRGLWKTAKPLGIIEG
ncbi:MAG: Gfo/Idh/MocA family oxidoreductase [Candidatus Sumerlaeota bacterium]|nr:Gfo/Idh/MocA family oxidoreductase [Candidatus Sumerlaeota bacterium]